MTDLTKEIEALIALCKKESPYGKSVGIPTIQLILTYILTLHHSSITLHDANTELSKRVEVLEKKLEEHKVCNMKIEDLEGLDDETIQCLEDKI